MESSSSSKEVDHKRIASAEALWKEKEGSRGDARTKSVLRTAETGDEKKDPGNLPDEMLSIRESDYTANWS